MKKSVTFKSVFGTVLLLSLLASIFFNSSCQKEVLIQQEEMLLKSTKLDICHWDEENGSWVAISIPYIAYEKAHVKNGDIKIEDKDGDGWYVFNECSINNPDGLFDCDDDDININPDANEICGDEIDNDCDGEIDESCIFANYNFENIEFDENYFLDGIYDILLPFKKSYLSFDAQQVNNDDNSGGSSIYADAISMEILNKLGFSLFSTESEIEYTASGAQFKMIVTKDGNYFGVSTARAMGFPDIEYYSITLANNLIDKKLAEIAQAENNLSLTNTIYSSILIVLACNTEISNMLETSWIFKDETIKENSKLIVVATAGDDTFIYD